MQSRSPIVSAPPPKKQRSNESLQPISMIQHRERQRPPVDHIDDALEQRRIQLRELRRQQLKSDLLSKARSQLTLAPPTTNGSMHSNTHSANPNNNREYPIDNSNANATQGPFATTTSYEPSSTADTFTDSSRDINIHPEGHAMHLDESVPLAASDTSSISANHANTLISATPKPPSIPPQEQQNNTALTTSSGSGPPSTAAPPRPPPLPSPSSPEIVRRLNFVTSAPPKPVTPPSNVSTGNIANPHPVPKASEELPSLLPDANPQVAVYPNHPVTTTATDAALLHSRPMRGGPMPSSLRSSARMRPPPITPSLGSDVAAAALHAPANEAASVISTDPPLQQITKNGTIPSTVEQSPTSTTTTATISRQEFISSMHEAADSPDTATKRNSELTMIRELKKVHQDKEDAFRQVVRLREQIQKLQKHQDALDSHRGVDAHELKKLVEIADRNGDRAALKWAREQASASKSLSKGLYPKSPLSTHGRTSSPSRRAMAGGILIGTGVRKRVSTPHPKRQQLLFLHDDADADSTNGDDAEMLAKATETNPDEFDSEFATYYIRRPYVLAHNEEFWSQVSELSSEDYRCSADIFKPASLEAAAKIKADGSILLLSGVCTVRHKKPRSTKWRTFEDVDDMDKPLGSVMYVDGQANEREYWLDEIYEEAMSTRDTYCSSLMATSSALKSTMAFFQRASFTATNDNNDGRNNSKDIVEQQNGIALAQQVSSPQAMPPLTADDLHAKHSVPTHHSSVSPPIMFQQPPPVEEANALQPVHPSLMASEKPEPKHAVVESTTPIELSGVPVEKKAVVPPSSEINVTPHTPDDDDDAASDILSSTLGVIFLCLFKMCYFFLIRLPLRIMFWSSMAAVMGIFLSMMWLYLADDHGAEELGASLGYGFNRPGIQ